MGKRPKRKVVLFLVEGKSDRAALQIAIPQLFDRIDSSYEVFFPSIREDSIEVGGDITSRIGVHPRNIEENIYNLFLRHFFDEEKILPKDIVEIIQIVDTDGVYIPDECIIEEKNPTGASKPFYDIQYIKTLSPQHIIKRNECKRENLDYLSSLDTIKVKQKAVKYSVYYFSSNLDHYLHENANLASQEKYICADGFAIKYIDNTEEFISFLEDAELSTLDYSESWKYIKEDTNSLKRHTNIGLMFKRLVAE